MKVFYLGNTRPDHPPGVHSALYSDYPTIQHRFQLRFHLSVGSLRRTKSLKLASSSSSLSGARAVPRLCPVAAIYTTWPVRRSQLSRLEADTETLTAGNDRVRDRILLFNHWRNYGSLNAGLRGWIGLLVRGTMRPVESWPVRSFILRLYDIYFSKKLKAYYRKKTSSLTIFPEWIFSYPWSLSQQATPFTRLRNVPDPELTNGIINFVCHRYTVLQSSNFLAL